MGSGGAGSSDAGGAASERDTGSAAVADAGGGDGGAGGHRAADAACTTVDMCPAPNGGITVDCEKRFLFGENYAWQNWGTTSAAARPESPETRRPSKPPSRICNPTALTSFGGGCSRNSMAITVWSSTPTGFRQGNARGTLVADVQAALSLAAQVGVHYNFTLFSFDDFVFSAGRYDMNIKI